MKKNISKKIILSTILLGFSSSLFAATEVEDSYENEHETVILNQDQVQNEYRHRYGKSGQEHGMNVEMGLSHGEGHKYGISGHVKFNGEDKELNCECPSEDTNLDLTGESVVDTERVITDRTNSIEIPESDILDITRQIDSLDNVSEEDKNSIKDKILNEISTNPNLTVEERNTALNTIVRDTVDSKKTPTVSEKNEEGISEELFTKTETPDIVNTVPAPQVVEETFFSAVYLGKNKSNKNAETGISKQILPYSGRHLRVSTGNFIYVKLKVCENGKKGFEVVTSNKKVPEKISFDSCTQAKIKIIK